MERIFFLPSTHFSQSLLKSSNQQAILYNLKSKRMSSPCSISNLPNEILDKISNLLDPRDIKTFRATSKQIHERASQYLFRRVYMALRPRTLEVFENIAKHPLFSKNVTEIIFDAGPFLGDHEHLKKRYKVPLHLHAKDRKCGIHYRRLLESQNRLLASDWLFMRPLIAESSSFPRLESFEILEWREICRRVNPEWYLYEGLNSSSEWYLEEWYLKKGPMSSDLNLKTVCLPGCLSWGGDLDQTFINQLLWWLNRCRIQKVHITGKMIDLAPNSSLRQQWHERDIHQSSEASNSLVSFEASLFRETRDAGADPTSATISFTNLLASFSNLRHLQLIISTIDLGVYGQYFFIKDCHWPNLEQLKLIGDEGAFMVSSDSLMKFLGRHSKTLRAITLEGVFLVETRDTWIDVVQKMRQGMTALKVLHFSKVQEVNSPVPNISVRTLIDGVEGFILEDSKYRRGHLDILERWAVLKEPDGYEASEQREAFEEVKKGWHDRARMLDMQPQISSENEIDLLRPRGIPVDLVQLT